MGRPSMAPETEQNKFSPNLTGGMVQSFSQFLPNTAASTKNVKNRWIYRFLTVPCSKSNCCLAYPCANGTRNASTGWQGLVWWDWCLQWERFLARMWWERDLTPTRSFTHLSYIFWRASPPAHPAWPTLPFPSLLLVECYQWFRVARIFLAKQLRSRV